MQNNRYVVIMGGGSGTRLWPISRTNLPKQLHRFSSEKSLIQETFERVKNLVPKENIYVSLVKPILKYCEEQLPNIHRENYIVEPEGKNTAPAIGLVAATIFKRDPQAIVITIASDHVVNNVTNFTEAIKSAFAFVEKNPQYFTTVGIKPTRPDTGLGYIKVGRKFENSRLHAVEKFVEKPNEEVAEKYLASGEYLWNASYFVWRADKLIAMYEKHAPDIYKHMKEILRVVGQQDSQKVIDKIYKSMPKEPIDTAIAEKVEDIAVVPADLGWSDIGSWATLYDLLSSTKGTHTVSEGNHIGVDDKNCLIYAQDKLLATVGLEDIVIVDTPDVTLVCNKNKSQDIKKLIEKLKEQKQDKYL